MAKRHPLHVSLEVLALIREHRKPTETQLETTERLIKLGVASVVRLEKWNAKQKEARD